MLAGIWCFPISFSYRTNWITNCWTNCYTNCLCWIVWPLKLSGERIVSRLFLKRSLPAFPKGLCCVSRWAQGFVCSLYISPTVSKSSGRQEFTPPHSRRDQSPMLESRLVLCCSLASLWAGRDAWRIRVPWFLCVPSVSSWWGCHNSVATRQKRSFSACKA